jgi:hypothetical protein
MVGQGVYQDYKIIKSSYGIDLHALDVVDVIQPRYIAKDAGLIPEGASASLSALVECYGLGLASDWWLHNAGNDAVATLIVGVLASLHHKLHPIGSTRQPTSSRAVR